MILVPVNPTQMGGAEVVSLHATQKYLLSVTLYSQQKNTVLTLKKIRLILPNYELTTSYIVLIKQITNV